MDTGESSGLDALTDALLGRVDSGTDRVLAAFDRFGATPAERSSFMEAVRLHRAEVGRLERRERELAALYSSARELAQLRDIDALLGRLVTRAHEMMGTDVTYLSEFDSDTRELRVRKTAGAVTRQFQNLLVPTGMGLASQVVSSGAPQSVRRYDQYSEGPHADTIDDAVASEGIVSILGVPMLSDGRVLGVLFAATRHEHTFTPDEIALLAALADHASVVVQTANTLEQVRRSEDEARSALERLTEHVQARDLSNIVHQQLIEAVLLGGGFPQIARTLASTLGRETTIVDAELRPVAASLPEGVSGTTGTTPAVREAVSSSRATGHCCIVDDPDTNAVAAITAGDLFFGAILLGRGDLELGPVERRTVERAAQVGAVLALQQNAVDDADRRARVELVADLLDPAPERRRDLERRVRAQNVVLADLETVVLLSPAPDERAAVARVVARMLDGVGLVGEHGGSVVVVLAATAPADTVARLRGVVKDSFRGAVRTVTAPGVSAPGDLPGAFETVLRTERLLDALGSEDVDVHTDAYLPYAVLFDADGRTLRAFIDRTIGVVRRYDEARGTDLVATLRAFVRNDASPTKTARALNYHTNTVLQRLDRLKSLLGERWREDENLFRISAAVRLDELGRP
ncbi:helix-turn-helix domain-containing protein [Rhodococcus gannanensis]|uniref:Helix-turn-helix domain-containing protein n=1 Tax=Rhodococcus gannanensis TaxID=1960308 RepID=A0ABW4P810_9NOCA